MGGRGTFAVGRNVPFTYETVGKIGDVKILKGLNGKHGLPEESHTSNIYISLDCDGTVKQIRVYENHSAVADYEFSFHKHTKSLHAHDYVNGIRQGYRELTTEELSKYKVYFGGKHDKK